MVDLDQFGFWDFVRSPRLWCGVGRLFAQKDRALRRLMRLSPHQLVEMLLHDEGHWLAAQAIEETGASTVHPLLEALDDQRSCRQTDPDDQERIHWMFRRSTPLVSVLSCLRGVAPVAAFEGAVRFVDHEDPNVRREAAHIVGMSGNAAAAEPLRRALDDANDDVWDQAMEGVLEAIDAGRASPAFAQAAFDAIEPLVTRANAAARGNAPRCLLELDRARAVHVLTERVADCPDGAWVHHALTAMLEERAAVPADLLTSLYERLKHDVDGPSELVVAAAVRLLAQSNSSGAARILDEADASPSPRVGEAVARARLGLLGVDEPLDAVWDCLGRSSWKGIDRPVVLAAAVHELGEAVFEGGFAGYLLNSSGAHWREAIDGLRAIGATSDVETLNSAVRRFGPQGPAPGLGRRRRELARIALSQEDPFASLDSAFHGDVDGRSALLLKYIARNIEAFR